MRQHYGVGLGMRQVPGPAQGMAQLVVQRHAHAAQHRAAQPRAIEAVRTRIDVGGIFHHPRQAACQRAYALLGHQRHDGVGVLGVESLDRMGDGVHAARSRHARGQAQREQGVVDHRARQHLAVTTGLFHARFGNAVDRRHFRTGVSGGDGKDGQRRFERDGFAQSRRRPAAYGDGAVCTQALGLGARFARRLDRHMHHRARKNSGAAPAQPPCHIFGLGFLFRRGEHQRARCPEQFDFTRQVLERAGAKYHAAGKLVVDEGLHAQAALACPSLSGTPVRRCNSSNASPGTRS